MSRIRKRTALGAAVAAVALLATMTTPGSSNGSSHREAPLVADIPAADPGLAQP